MSDFQDAMKGGIGGLEKRTNSFHRKKKIIAYHEAGHAICIGISNMPIHYWK